MKRLTALIYFLGFIALTPMTQAAETTPPEQFYNDPEGIHSDPNYVPGEYALPEIHAAKTVYQAKSDELAQKQGLLDRSTLVTLAAGQVTFSAQKNETAQVLGYFRDFFGVLSLEGGVPARMEMVIDINSLDTAVPGRNNRIMDLFFQSAKPELGTAAVVFDRFDLGEKKFSEFKEGESYPVTVGGRLTLNQTERELTAKLSVMKHGSGWSVKTTEPLWILISDFGFSERVPAFLKACNHKALGNRVEVNVDLLLK